MKLIGERAVFFWNGEAFRFEYMGQGEWRCTSHSCGIPSSVLRDLEVL